MRFYDLFCGIGGFRLGLERAGHTNVGSCEIEKHARTIYGKNFGAEPEHRDITEVDARDIPDHDILAAGFPCQAFSVAGKRLGFADTRGTLFFEIARIARQKRPQYLFLENVKGLLSHDNGRTFGTIINTLDEMGYDAEWQVINGRYFLPQNRERVFIIGHSRGKPFRQVFPLGSSEGKAGEGITTHNIDANYWKGIDNHGARTAIALTERRTEEAREIRRNMRQHGKDWSPRRGKELVPREDNIMNCLTASPSREHLLLEQQSIRTLTPLECERLQGFPDGWTEGIPEQARYRCLGNAVMPPVVKYIADAMAEHKV